MKSRKVTILINGLQSSYLFDLNQKIFDVELYLGDPVVVLIEDVVFCKFDDTVDVIILFFTLGNGFFINLFEFDLLSNISSAT